MNASQRTMRWHPRTIINDVSHPGGPYAAALTSQLGSVRRAASTNIYKHLLRYIQYNHSHSEFCQQKTLNPALSVSVPDKYKVHGFFDELTCSLSGLYKRNPVRPKGKDLSSTTLHFVQTISRVETVWSLQIALALRARPYKVDTYQLNQQNVLNDMHFVFGFFKCRIYYIYIYIHFLSVVMYG